MPVRVGHVEHAVDLASVAPFAPAAVIARAMAMLAGENTRLRVGIRGDELPVAATLPNRSTAAAAVAGSASDVTRAAEPFRLARRP